MYKIKKIPDIIKSAARELRKNPTVSEEEIWNYLRNSLLGYRFQRQFPIYVYTEDSGLDRYIIPDFYCSEKKCIIEIDGNIHQDTFIYDLDRYKEQLLQEQGYSMFRIKNQDIFKNTPLILKQLQSFLNSLQPLALEKGKDSGKGFVLSEEEPQDSGKGFVLSEGEPQDSEKGFVLSEEEAQDSGKLPSKRFIMRNESFACENCKNEVSKHPSGSARNHCPFCLHSKHLDQDFPGDRLSSCFGLMKPVAKEHKKKGWMIMHECQICGKKIPNILAGDDNLELFAKL